MISSNADVKAGQEVFWTFANMYDEASMQRPYKLRKYIRRWLTRSSEVRGETLCQLVGIDFDPEKKYFVNTGFCARGIYFETIASDTNLTVTKIGWAPVAVLLDFIENAPATKPPLPPEKMIYTAHASKRFKERYKTLHTEIISANLDSIMRNVFAGAVAEELHPAERVRRLLDHGLVDTHFFRNGNWEFVVVEENGFYSVVTIVRI